jgi:acetyl-CoA carboxylase biotin carboxyl carrier protein
MAEYLNGGSGGEELGRICQGLADVVRIAPSPLRRVRMQLGSSRVEIEWWEPPSVSSSAAAAMNGPQLEEELPAPPGLYPVCAPLVGTFYRAPEPGARPFVKIGDEVQPGQQVAVVEAMKLMHSVEADIAGRVVAILVADAEPVEYGQQLLHLELPDGA